MCLFGFCCGGGSCCFVCVLVFGIMKFCFCLCNVVVVKLEICCVEGCEYGIVVGLCFGFVWGVW